MLTKLFIAVGATTLTAPHQADLAKDDTTLAVAAEELLKNLREKAAKRKSGWRKSDLDSLNNAQLKMENGLIWCAGKASVYRGFNAPMSVEQVEEAIEDCPNTSDSYIRVARLVRYASESPTNGAIPELRAPVTNYLRSYSGSLGDFATLLKALEERRVVSVEPGPASASFEARPPAPNASEMEGAIRTYLATYLKDPYTVQMECRGPSKWMWIKESWAHKKRYGYLAQCKINARNSFGGYVGSRDHYFLFSGSELYHIPELMMGWKTQVL